VVEGTLQIVSTPTIDWLSKAAANCNSRLLIASPFVNDGITELTGLVSSVAARILVTRTDLRDFAAGASDLDTLCKLAATGVRIRSLTGLHAKIYIFDNTSALVTSANATYSGLRRNLECGLETTDKDAIRRLAKHLLAGLGLGNPPRTVTKEELESLKTPLSAIRVSIQKPVHVPKVATSEILGSATFNVTDEESLLSAFEGWLRLTLWGVFRMPKTGFRLAQLVSVCEPVARKQYPRNLHVPDKIRQQLQMLRDLGLVDFVTPGVYRRTIES